MFYWLTGKGVLGLASFEGSGVFSVLEPPAAAGVVAVAQECRGKYHRRRKTCLETVL